MRITMTLLALFAFVQGAGATQIVSVLGSPDPSQHFVRAIVKRRIPLSGGPHETRLSTQVASLFSREHLHSMTAVEILDTSGSTSTQLLLRGLELGASAGPVVFAPIGPIKNVTCETMASHPDTAFVLAAGNEGAELDLANLPDCLAENILLVAALDPAHGALMPASNWSAQLVRIAAAPRDFAANHGTLAAAQVAAELARFATLHTTLTGDDLIELFLEERTTLQASLFAKIKDGRILRRSPRN